VQRGGLVIEHQGIRADVVGTQPVAVESAVVVDDGRKDRAIDHEVATDLAHAAVAQIGQHLPQMLPEKLRIAARAHPQIAHEDIARQRGLGDELRLPGVGRAEQLERGIGGDQLDGRGRVLGQIGLHREHGLVDADFLDEEARVGRA